jgi:hypothetical protein
MAWLSKKLMILVILSLLVLPVIPLSNKANTTALRTEWLTEEEKRRRGDTSYGYMRVVGRFDQKWLEFHQPITFILAFLGFCPQGVVVKIGVFSDHEFLDDDVQNQFDDRPRCIGVRIKELENTGWMWNKQIYYRCYGFQFQRYSTCVY